MVAPCSTLSDAHQHWQKSGSNMRQISCKQRSNATTSQKADGLPPVRLAMEVILREMSVLLLQ
jgi:hypothetical protein